MNTSVQDNLLDILRFLLLKYNPFKDASFLTWTRKRKTLSALGTSCIPNIKNNNMVLDRLSTLGIHQSIFLYRNNAITFATK